VASSEVFMRDLAPVLAASALAVGRLAGALTVSGAVCNRVRAGSTPDRGTT
jgi:hypothetical protein